MDDFSGRETDLARLDHQRHTAAETGRGVAVVLSGRRRVGKSRLAQELCDRSGLPYLVFQATKGRNPAAERADFMQAVGESGLPGAELVRDLRAGDWNQALGALASVVPEHRPSILVLDEVPWLVEQDREFEGALQTIWDRHLSAKPVLLLLVGSDLSVMEGLQSYGRPFHGRATRMVLRPLDLHDVAAATGLAAADAVDAYLITGGLPELVRSWRPGTSVWDYLRANLTDPLSRLLVAGELTLLSEFPEPTYARQALEAIGTGETTFGAIASHLGGGAAVPSGSLAPVLANLLAKQVVAAEVPLSTKPDGRNKRYRVADHYLRFWLAFLRRGVAESERGRGDLVLTRIERSWAAWRGRAVEPLVRESLERSLPDDRWPDTAVVGGWWNRQNNPEIDLVGADRSPVARTVHFVGTVKWLDRQFDQRDLDQLVRSRPAVPGTDEATPLVAVSRAGFAPGLPLARAWEPVDLIRAWEPRQPDRVAGSR
ncbi:MAG: ATP-binding protein [Natronosporangium sp.]